MYETLNDPILLNIHIEKYISQFLKNFNHVTDRWYL